MATIHPFRPLVYATAAGDLDGLIAPPYDVISVEDRAALVARAPHNAVHLEVPAGPEEDVADLIRAWRQDGVLERPDRPGLFAWTQTFDIDGVEHTRRSLLTAVGLEPYSAGVVRPHERTHQGPIDGRLRLYRATTTQISPIFGVYPDSEGAVWAATDVGEVPDRVFVSDDGAVTNRIWWIDGPEALDAVREAMRDRWILIADGHHRYETGLRYRDEVRAGNGDQAGPWDTAMMGLSALEDPGLVILPTHRVLTEWPGSAASRMRREPATGLNEVLARLAAAAPDEPVFGLRTGAGWEVMVGPAPPPGATPGERLDVAVLERELLIPDFGADQARLNHDGRLGYIKDAAEADRLVDSGEAAAVVVLRSLPKASVAAVSDAREVMPQKSTYFFPKLCTGVGFHPLADG